MSEPILQCENTSVIFDVPGGQIRAVDGIDLELFAGETLAVVGESGCGKSTLARAILGLEPLAGGKVNVQNEPVRQNLSGLAKRVGIVWQDPYASLDPRWRIGRSIAEPLLVNGETAEPRVAEVMKQVGLDPNLKDRFPHQLSGGQRQRVAIARALALNPPLVLCDEPTAALDLSIRAQILNLLRDLQRDLGCAYLYISHDLSTVRFIADRVAVMYLGKIVETGPTKRIFDNPRHPYTKALMNSAPTMANIGKLPAVLPGEIPDPREHIVGCRFASRCPNKQPVCLTDDPPITLEPATSPDPPRSFFCHFPVG